MLFDADLNAQLLEINLQPALGTRTPLDLELKRKLVRDLFDLAEIRVPGAGKLKGQTKKQESSLANAHGGFRLIYPPEGQIGEAVSLGTEKSEL